MIGGAVLATARWLSRWLHSEAPIAQQPMASIAYYEPEHAPRHVGTCGTCGEAVLLFPRARLAACPEGCTLLTRSEMEGGGLG